MNKKEITEPINVRSTLKSFLESKKQMFKNKVGKFVGTPEILMFYLEDSDKFVKDFSEYTGKAVLPSRTTKIFSYMDEDVLSQWLVCRNS